MRAATFRNEICPDGAGQSGKREMDSSREKKGCHVQTTKPHALLDKSLTCVALEIITNKNLENLPKKIERNKECELERLGRRKRQANRDKLHLKIPTKAASRKSWYTRLNYALAL